MKNLDKIIFNKADNTYYLNGKRIPRVTKILQKIAKGEALQQWIANESVKSAKKGVVDPGLEWKRQRDRAGVRGKKIHKAIEKWVKTGKLPTTLPKKYHISFFRFCCWYTDQEAKCLFSEKIVYSKKYWYAGQLDMVVIIRNQVWILDIKTSSQIWDEFFYQTAAYQGGVEEMKLLPKGMKFAGHIIVNLPPSGAIRVKRRVARFYDYDFNKFKAALELNK